MVSLDWSHSVVITKLLDIVSAAWHIRHWRLSLSCLVIFKLTHDNLMFRWCFSSSITRLILMFESQSITHTFLQITFKQSCTFYQKGHNPDCLDKSNLFRKILFNPAAAIFCYKLLSSSTDNSLSIINLLKVSFPFKH